MVRKEKVSFELKHYAIPELVLQLRKEKVSFELKHYVIPELVAWCEKRR